MRKPTVGALVLVHHTELLRDEEGKVKRAEPGPGQPGIITAVDDEGLVAVHVFGAPTYAGLPVHDTVEAAHADAESPRHAPGIVVCYPAEEQAEDKPAKKAAAAKTDPPAAPEKPPAS